MTAAVLQSQPRIGDAYEGGLYIGDGEYRVVLGPHHLGTTDWASGMTWAQRLDVGGIKDWHLPTVRELLLLSTGLPELIRDVYPYWSCEQEGDDAVAVFFDACLVERNAKINPAHAVAVRCVFIGGGT